MIDILILYLLEILLHFVVELDGKLSTSLSKKNFNS